MPWGRGRGWWGRGRGWFWGFRGNPFPFCRFFPWLPRWWWLYYPYPWPYYPYSVPQYGYWWTAYWPFY